MHFRRLASFLLGVWIGGSFFMTVVATQNLRLVDRQLATPGASGKALEALGPQTGRRVLRHYASELNRSYFVAWEWAQVGIGGLFLITLLAGGRETPFTLGAAAAMLSIVLLFRFVLTPQITELGRMLDFQPPNSISPERSRFWSFHNAYTSLELVKWALGLGLMLKFAIARRRSADVADDIDAIEKAHYRHVDR